MRASRITAAAAAVPLMLVSFAGAAMADNVVNDVNAAVGDNTILTGGSTTIGYKVNANGGDGQNGCNASDGTPARVTLSVPSGVTASATSLTFNACGEFQHVTFSSNTAGDYNINVSSIQDSGAGSYSNQANWTLHVSAPAPPANTAPSVTVGGVTNGASYEIGSVPAATCDVTDAEDTNESATPVITGTLSHGLGSQTATCSYTDGGGLSDSDSKSYTIVDTGDPTISHTLSPAAANTHGWYKDNVTVDFTCADIGGSGIDTCVGDTTLGEGASQSVTGTATDWAGNTKTDTVSGINIDKTAPLVSLVGGPSGSYYFGSVPNAPTCSASDALSGLDGTCSVSGYSTAVGSHTLQADAKDRAGNTASDTRSYNVLAWTTKGFYAPVDMSTSTTTVWNTVKGGSTVPLKFELFAGSTELTDISAVQSFTTAVVSCNGAGTDVADEIEVVTTGGTSLRYDSTGGQFIQNWKTPTTAGSCYRATMTSDDGSTIMAFFKTRK